MAHPTQAALQKAEAILNAYGRVLEVLAQPMAAPLSLLPFPKQQIKEALLLMLRNLQLDEQVRNAIGVGLINLGMFVPDADAALVNRWFKGQPLSSNPRLESASHDKVKAILAQIKAEQELLLSDWEASS